MSFDDLGIGPRTIHLVGKVNRPRGYVIIRDNGEELTQKIFSHDLPNLAKEAWKYSLERERFGLRTRPITKVKGVEELSEEENSTFWENYNSCKLEAKRRD